ncbi:helix-turn-helix domain-containing protein [Staphylococcus nepalensis]|uniref:helix-turn-helix domain-containing protein n=1 Tax=Staphylococcus nepalensis TaxID=214473 RepID=UPI001A992256|nr:helix-turn-helix transcriptional regulator [Staphylococcus nepalensis]MBO1220466.1 helix-turn-helix transcriptional regulator [Staphylococcus nepalensis]
MIEKELSPKIGKKLKEIRKSHKVSAKKIGEVLGYSQSHVSGIENGTKIIPNKKFITNYLKFVTNSNFSEMNFYINNINEIANGEIQIATYLDNSTSLLNAFVNDYEDDSSQINSLKYEKRNGETEKKHFDFAINDLIFHLTDTDNPKYFNKIKLSANDREHINKYIEDYIVLKYKNYLDQLNDLYNKNKINEKSYNQEYYQIDRILKSIKGDNYGKL